MASWLAGAALMLVSLIAAAATRTVDIAPVRDLVLGRQVSFTLVNRPGRQFVRLTGPKGAIAGVHIRQDGSTLFISGTGKGMAVDINAAGLRSVTVGSPDDTTRGRRCSIALSGAARTHLGSIVGDIVQIYLDGGSRLDIDRVTARIVTTDAAGSAREGGN